MKTFIKDFPDVILTVPQYFTITSKDWTVFNDAQKLYEQMGILTKYKELGKKTKRVNSLYTAEFKIVGIKK